jgi:hypothetical protein
VPPRNSVGTEVTDDDPVHSVARPVVRVRTHAHLVE